jgi:DNA-binding protein HU-beta
MALTAPQLKERLADLLEIPKNEADDILWAIEEIAIECVEKADEFSLPGIGKLYCRVSESRAGRNPATGEALTIPAKVRVGFTVSKALKDKAPKIKTGRKLIEAREAEKKKKNKKSKRGAHLRKNGKTNVKGKRGPGRPKGSGKKKRSVARY